MDGTPWQLRPRFPVSFRVGHSGFGLGVGVGVGVGFGSPIDVRSLPVVGPGLASGIGQASSALSVRMRMHFADCLCSACGHPWEQDSQLVAPALLFCCQRVFVSQSGSCAHFSADPVSFYPFAGCPVEAAFAPGRAGAESCSFRRRHQGPQSRRRMRRRDRLRLGRRRVMAAMSSAAPVSCMRPPCAQQADSPERCTSAGAPAVCRVFRRAVRPAGRPAADSISCRAPFEEGGRRYVANNGNPPRCFALVHCDDFTPGGRSFLSRWPHVPPRGRKARHRPTSWSAGSRGHGRSAR